jgi:hypothetical protein
MKYHFQQGTDKRRRKQRLHLAAASSLLVIAASASVLYFRGSQAEGRQNSANVAKTSSAQLRARDCGGGGAKRQGLSNSPVSQLRKLSEYEFVCGGGVVSRVSFFVPLPTTKAEATAQAEENAATLKEFAKNDLSPLVFLEPTRVTGGLVDVNTYRSGGYDAALDTYFAALKAAGITDIQMGMWNPFPEGNIPVWGDTNPATHTAIVRRTVQIQKKYFPASKASILLESKTYPSGNSWEGGRYASLLPYVRGFPAGLIDSFGLQGFPWGKMSKLDVSVLEPAVYLRADLAIEAAATLGVQEVWFNTGTFATFHKGTGMPMLYLGEKQRQQILENVLTQAKAIKAAGLKPVVHLFARDKSQTDEKIDWSYWKAGQMNSSPATQVFKTFVSDARAANVPLWLYDDDTE